MAIDNFHIAPLGAPLAVSLSWRSAPVLSIQSAVAPSPPAFSVAPSISGAVKVEQVLTGADGTITGGTLSARAWLRNGVAIAGATATTYTLVDADRATSITYRVTATGDGGPTSATSAAVGPIGAADVPITAIAANGWQSTAITPANPPTLTSFDIDRAGFNSTGTATTITAALRLTKRVRQAFPNQASFTADSVAISDWVYADDVMPGVTNNSTLVSPKAIAGWMMADRLTVGNSITWEIAAFHINARLGKQVACVRVRGNDGTTQTAWQVVSTTVTSTMYDDAHAPDVYTGVLDITALANVGLVWLEAEVFPHFGVAASVLKSEDRQASGLTLQYEFARRYFRKDTGRAAAPPFAYVSSAGNDATGVISTTAATAKATPFLTVGGALIAARTALGTTNGTFDNFHIRITNSVNMGTVPFNTYWQDIGAVIIERDPDVTRAAANLTLGATFRAYWSNKSTAVTTGALIFRDLTFTVGAIAVLQGEAAQQLHIQFINCNTNFANFTVSLRGQSHLSFFGGNWSNYNTNCRFAAGELVRIIRGITANLAGTSMQQYVTVGCSFTNAPDAAAANPANDGTIVYNNSFLSPGNLFTPIRIVGAVPGGNLGSFAIVQNIIERTTTNSRTNIAVSADSHSGNVVNGVMHHNTAPGDGDFGRFNLLYDETAGQARTHGFFSCKGNISPQLNTKSDVFISLTARTGNFAFLHGVGCAGNFTEDVDAGGGTFAQAYGGVGSVIAGGDPLYTDDRATEAGPIAGLGGGVYTLGGASPARDLFSSYLLARDIAGAVRPTSGTVDAGAYA